MTAVLAAVLLASAAGTLALRRQPRDWRTELLNSFTDPAARKEPQP